MSFLRTINRGIGQSRKTRSLGSFVLVCLGLLLLNVLGGFVFTRLDLTEDRRYTLAPTTKELMRGLEDVVSIEVYLDGDLPAPFQRLKDATRELLEQFRALSPNIQFRFMDPMEGSKEQVQQMQRYLKERGFAPYTLSIPNKGQVKEQLVFPFALVTFRTQKPFRITLLENRTPNQSDQEAINNAVNLLEFKFANAINKLLSRGRPLVLFTTGHGELDSMQTAELRYDLGEFYNVEFWNLDQSYSVNRIVARPDTTGLQRLDTLKVDLLVVAKPRLSFSEKDLFKIDQYLMQGGRVLWLLDTHNADMDSLEGGTQKTLLPLDLPMNNVVKDLLFRYGARVNPDVVTDAQSHATIDLVVGREGNKPQIARRPWWYFPVVYAPNPVGAHPIVKRLDGVMMRFPSSIDTVGTKTPVRKTVLLASSQLSRRQSMVRISLDDANMPLVPERFDKRYLPTAVLLEGRFPSSFEGRVPPAMDSALRKLNTPFRSVSEPTKQIVVSDGDVGANLFDRRVGELLRMGENPYSGSKGYVYGNRDFLINCIDFLTDKRGIVAARNKDFVLRLLNKEAVNDSATGTLWQAVNIGLPLLFLAVFGLVYAWARKRRFGRR